MRTRIASILVVIIMAVTLIPFALSSNNTAVAKEPEPIINCQQLSVSGGQVRIQCSAAGVIVLNTVIDLPLAPPATVEVPGPTETVKVNVTGPTKTVTATDTKTVSITETATTGPGPQPTKTVTLVPQQNLPSALPTVTVTPKNNSSGQVVTESVTVAPATTTATAVVTQTVAPEVVPGNDSIDIIPGVPGVVEKAALGALSLIALIAIILIGMWLGYYIGYKDSDRANARFMNALRDQIITRKS